MFQEYKRIDTVLLGENATFVHPETGDIVDLDSPCSEVFTDFSARPPVTTTEGTKASKALEEMKHAKVKSLIVVDELEYVTGIVTIRDLTGLKLGTVANDRGIKQTEVRVHMIMTPASQIQTIEYKLLDGLRVGHIARIMHEEGFRHLLATEVVLGIHSVRGIFSATRMSRQLGEEVSGDLSGHSVAEMEHNIPKNH